MDAINPQVKENIANELATLEALASEFEDYIIDGQVYRTVLVSTQQGNYRVEMSGGDLLARVDTLQTIRPDLPGPLKDQLNGVITQIETTKQELKTRFHELLQRELKARRNTLQWSEDDRTAGKEGEDEDRMTPAENHNRHCIAVIRDELQQS